MNFIEYFYTLLTAPLNYKSFKKQTDTEDNYVFSVFFIFGIHMLIYKALCYLTLMVSGPSILSIALQSLDVIYYSFLGYNLLEKALYKGFHDPDGPIYYYSNTIESDKDAVGHVRLNNQFVFVLDMAEVKALHEVTYYLMEGDPADPNPADIQ